MPQKTSLPNSNSVFINETEEINRLNFKLGELVRELHSDERVLTSINSLSSTLSNKTNDMNKKSVNFGPGADLLINQKVA